MEESSLTPDQERDLTLLLKDYDLREKELENRLNWQSKLLLSGTAFLTGLGAIAGTMMVKDVLHSYFWVILLPVPIVVSMVGLALLQNCLRIVDITVYQEQFLVERIQRLTKTEAFQWRKFLGGKSVGVERPIGNSRTEPITSSLMHLLHAVPMSIIFAIIIAVPLQYEIHFLNTWAYWLVAFFGLVFYLAFFVAGLRLYRGSYIKLRDGSKVGKTSVEKTEVSRRQAVGGSQENAPMAVAELFPIQTDEPPHQDIKA